jgi:signal peptidase I
MRKGREDVMEEERRAVGEQKKSLWKVLHEWAEAITIALAVLALVFAFLFRIVSVDGTSMNATLQHGDRLILSRLPYSPAYEDIVVIKLDHHADLIIKRIVGLPGDTIEINEAGEVYRNGTLLEESYVRVQTSMEEMERAVTVPDGCVFVMGDNRAPGRSWDSRTFGCIEQSALIGKAVFRVAPFADWGGLYE